MSFSSNAAVLPVLPKPEMSTTDATSDAGNNNCATVSPATVEDKELRKKLRNRQSALAARERKKARMLELERQVAELQEMNRRTEEENHYLRSRLEVMVRKCIRAGFRIEGDGYIYTGAQHQPAAVRVTGVPAADYSKVYVENHQQVSYGHQRVAMGAAACKVEKLQENPGVSPTEATLRSSIKELGQRQHEILQSMSYNDHIACRPNNPAVNRVYTIKQEFLDAPAEEQFYSPSGGYGHDASVTAAAAASPVRRIAPQAPGNAVPRFETHKRPLSEVNRQALPSIGSMLAPPPAKRPCAVSSPALQQSDHALSVVRQDAPTLVNNSRLSVASPAFQQRSEVSLDDSITLPQLSAPLMEDFELRDCSLSNSGSPMLLYGEELYGGLNCQAEAEKEEFPILEFKDILDGELSADSPSGLSGSDSGVSMDDSLDWITENPIYDI